MLQRPIVEVQVRIHRSLAEILMYRAEESRPNSGEYYCGQERASLAYLNNKAVQAALHVKPQVFSFQTSLDYNFTGKLFAVNGQGNFVLEYSLLDDYKSVLLNHYRVVQYSGDADPCVPYLGTQRWIQSLVSTQVSSVSDVTTRRVSNSDPRGDHGYPLIHDKLLGIMRRLFPLTKSTKWCSSL